MTTASPYDGTDRLADALADLYGFSPKNHNRVAELSAQAKGALGITVKANNLAPAARLAIYQWHRDRLHPNTGDPVNHESVELYSHTAKDCAVAINSQMACNEPVKINLQSECVELCSPAGNSDNAEIISHPGKNDAVDVFSQSGVVEINSQYNDQAIVRIAFYTSTGGEKKRQVIALDGFMINALMLATGITKRGVPKWVQQAVDSWAAFDPALPITKQVKLLLIRELTAALVRLKAECQTGIVRHPHGC